MDAPPLLEKFAELFKEQVTSTYRRSDVLRPLSWLLAILVPAFLISGFTGSTVVTYGIGIALGVLVAIYVLVYMICFFIDRDALRSERFVLNKMALQQKIYGDNLSGVLEARDLSTMPSDSITKLNSPT